MHTKCFWLEIWIKALIKNRRTSKGKPRTRSFTIRIYWTLKATVIYSRRRWENKTSIKIIRVEFPLVTWSNQSCLIKVISIKVSEWNWSFITNAPNRWKNAWELLACILGDLKISEKPNWAKLVIEWK